MPSYSGPNTFGEENLVFGYDTGDAANSYKGEPTENILALGGSDTEIERSGTSYPYYSINIDSYIQSRWSSSNNILTLSYEGKRDYVAGGTGGGNDGYPVYYIYFTDWSWAATLGTGAYDWQYVKQTFTMPDPTTKSVRFAVYHMNAGNRGRSYSRKHMLTFGDHAVPFVNGTRSATEGLIDLKGTSTIDLTNVSFDSNAQIEFDGTDEYVSVAYNTALNTPNGATYEIMLYPESDGEFLSRGKSDSGTDPDNPRFYIGSNGYLYFDWSTTGADTYVVTPAGAAAMNQWNHIVGIVQPADQLRIYVNGVESSYNTVTRTVPSPVPNSEDPITIGGAGWVPRYIQGKVGIVKLYNRALTSSEIQANYNAIKGRFNI